MRGAIPGPERHATHADTHPDSVEDGGVYRVTCLKTGCGWFEEGTYSDDRAEPWALRAAHTAGTLHEVTADKNDSESWRAKR